MLSVLVFLISAAQAGSGPWTLARSDQSLYVGIEGQGFTKLNAVLPDSTTKVEVDQGLSTFGLKAVGTFGIANHVEFEALVPYYDVHANREDGELCAALGPESCDRTRGIGVVETRLKVQVSDELVGRPLSVAVGGHARFGGMTAATRGRLTNLGEGTNDLGGFLSIGRSGGLGSKGGYWTAYSDNTALYRFPNTRAYPSPDGARAVPGVDMYSVNNALFAPRPAVAFGPEFIFAWRPQGLDFYELDLGDVDRFSALNVYSARAGGKLIVRDERNVAFIASFLYTVASRNNPSNVWVAQVGVNVNGLFNGRGT